MNPEKSGTPEMATVATSIVQNVIGIFAEFQASRYFGLKRAAMGMKGKRKIVSRKPKAPVRLNRPPIFRMSWGSL